MPIQTMPGYNPQAYVPGGSSTAVSRAIQRVGARNSPMKAYLTGYNPQAYVPGGSSPAVSKAIQTQGMKGVPITPTAPPVYQPAPVTDTTPFDMSTAAPNYGPGTFTAEDLMNAIKADPMYGVAEQNKSNAL